MNILDIIWIFPSMLLLIDAQRDNLAAKKHEKYKAAEISKYAITGQYIVKLRDGLDDAKVKDQKAKSRALFTDDDEDLDRMMALTSDGKVCAQGKKFRSKTFKINTFNSYTVSCMEPRDLRSLLDDDLVDYIEEDSYDYDWGVQGIAAPGKVTHLG